MAEVIVCTICHQECNSGPRLKDACGRYFHRDCYQRAMAEQESRMTAAHPVTSAANRTTAPRWRVGDHVVCSQLQCGAAFRITNEETAALNTLSCPECKSPLRLLPRDSAGGSSLSERPSDLSDLFDEEMPKNGCDWERRQLQNLFQKEETGIQLTRETHRLKLSLIAQCRMKAPLTCPKCLGDTPTDATSCNACGLHFQAGSVIARIANPSHLALQHAADQMAREERLAISLLQRAQKPDGPSRSGPRTLCMLISAVASIVAVISITGHAPDSSLGWFRYAAPGGLLMFFVFTPILWSFDD